MGDLDVLATAAKSVGLDEATARQVLQTNQYASQVREAEDHWRKAGINSVPAVIINDRYLISGGQPAEHFEQAIRQIAADAATPV